MTRGTLQTMFDRKAFDELKRLGLTEQSERIARSEFPEQTGMLVVEQVIPDTPAAGKLEPGDILIRINGELITEFVPLAAMLDENVGTMAELELERGGRKIVTSIEVTDLHSITPSEYLQFGDAIVNNLSYQQARHYNRAASGVYVANPGYLLSKAAIPRGAVITEFSGKPIANIDDFANALDELADGSRAQLRFVTMDSPQQFCGTRIRNGQGVVPGNALCA